MAMENIQIKKAMVMIMNNYYLNFPLIGKLKISYENNSLIEINYNFELISESGIVESEQEAALPQEVQKLKDQLTEYLQSKRKEFQLDYKVSGTDFQQRVLKETARIPYGQTLSYKELAEKAGSPRAWQATGQVLKNNKLPIIIPCHRVIGTNGPGGYNGGLKLKKALLNLEGFYYKKF